MARRGQSLREHILMTAKDIFVESGFERTSMDLVAARAETSKRSLYAHFETKDALFLAVVERVRELYLHRMGRPEDYAEDTAEAIALYCGRFLQMLRWRPVVRSCRLGISEADRLPDAAAGYHDAVFASTHERLADFLVLRLGLDRSRGADIAHHLVGRTVYPELARALFGLESLRTEAPETTSIAEDVDLATIRQAVDGILRLELGEVTV